MELGTNVTLNCRSSNETALVYFEHNSSIIPNGDSDRYTLFYGLENGTLLLKNIVPIHSGTYTCRAIIDATSQVLSDPATVTIASKNSNFSI